MVVMTRRLLAFVALVCAVAWPTLARADARLQGYCEDGNQTVSVSGIVSTTKVQRSYPACTVTIYAAGTTNLASIYSDNAGTPKANPFTADSSGYWFFYVPQQRVDVRFSGGGIVTPFTHGDYQAYDPDTPFGQVERLCQYTTLNVAVGAIGSTPTDLLVDCAYAVNADVTLPATASLHLTGAGVLTIASTKTLTANGPIVIDPVGSAQTPLTGSGTLNVGSTLTAPPVRIFGSALSVNFRPTTAAVVGEALYSEWWGAKADDATDNSTALQAWLTACGDTSGGNLTGQGTVCQLLPGTYRHSASITSTGAATIQGVGRQSTILKYTGGAAAAFIIDNSGHPLVLRDLGFDNIGTATVGISILNANVHLDQFYMAPVHGYTTAAIQSNTAGAVFSVTFSYGYLTVPNTATSLSARGIWILNSIDTGADHLTIEEYPIGIQVGQSSTTKNANFNCDRCLFDAHYTIAPTMIAIWADYAQQITLTNSYTQLCADTPPATLCFAQVLKMDKVDVGLVTGNFFDGTGEEQYVISSNAAAVHGVVIQGNTFKGIANTGAGIRIANGTNLFVGLNTSPDGSTIVSPADISANGVIELYGQPVTGAKTITGVAAGVSVSAIASLVGVGAGMAVSNVVTLTGINAGMEQTRVKSISQSGTASKNLAGSCTILDPATTCAVTLTTEPDAQYFVVADICGRIASGTPGFINVEDRLSTGFTIRTSVAPGAGGGVGVCWMLLR